ncbi:MAG: Ig domain-containing protein [Planctomycetes bacterium]|nr:Ig domain-containing protein [Planctomycetota bacterium]
MFEFRWKIPGDSPEDVVLHIRSWSGWLGRKQLTVGARTVFRRGWLEGIEARFADRDGALRFELRMLPISGTADWRPALFCDGRELPETSGTKPPRVVRPPNSLAIPVSVTYLLMLLAVIMSPQIGKMLDAFYLHYDDRKLVLKVADPNAAEAELSIGPPQLSAAVQGEPYSVLLEVVGGTPPYTWSPVNHAWPKGVSLDAASGELTCTPGYPHDYVFSVKLADSAREPETVERTFALVVLPSLAPGSDWPMIATMSLPPAKVGEPYEFNVQFEGGLPPYTWRTLGKAKLPKGVSIERGSGKIHGTPQKAGEYPVTIRVIDDTYAASRDVVPWLIPFVVTALCLLGYVGMRRWSVLLYGLVIIVQVVLAVAGVLPSSTTALGIQIGLWLVGAPHLPKMR